MTKILVIASHNQGKIREIHDLCAPMGYHITSAADYHVKEPIEDGITFMENALIKARHCAQYSQQLSLSDDSGFCVAALNNDPGLYSARWAGKNKDFDMAMDMVIEKWQYAHQINNDNNRDCHFICALALVDPVTQREYVFEGRVDGQLTIPKRGDKGFGYDALFTPNGYTQTFAEMEPNDKHAISHRAKAFVQLKSFLQSFI